MIEIEITPAPPVSRLLTRKEICQKEGIYCDPEYPSIRYVVNNHGQCFIFNDECKLYQSKNFNADVPRHLPVDEKIVFVATK